MPKQKSTSNIPVATVERFPTAIRAVDWIIESALASGRYPQGEMWRQEQAAEHVRHAFLHLETWLKGDESEDHLGHATTRTMMALQNHLAQGDPQPEPGSDALPPRPACWRCGAPGSQPAREEQLSILKYEHAKRSEVFWLRDSEIARLRTLMKPGDAIAVAVVPGLSPNYGSVSLVRDGKFVMVDRRELMDS